MFCGRGVVGRCRRAFGSFLCRQACLAVEEKNCPAVQSAGTLGDSMGLPTIGVLAAVLVAITATLLWLKNEVVHFVRDLRAWKGGKTNAS